MVDAALTTETLDRTRPEQRSGGADVVFRVLTQAAAALVLILFVGLIVALALGAWPAIKTYGFSFLITQTWNPATEHFGALAAIYGTLVSSFLAMLIALPMGIG